MVLNNIQSETESTTLLTLIRQLTTSITLYLPKAQREPVSSRAAKRFIELSKTVKPGSDLQFQLVKAIGTLATFEQGDWLNEVLTGASEIEGLEVDQDLRWELMAGLSTLGRIDLEQLEIELKGDNTANGQKAFALAKAALPDEQNKQAVWEELVQQDKMSNAILESASRGFTRVSDGSILEPYVDKYFDSVEKIWETKTFSIAEYLLLNLYPIEIASQSLRDKTAELIQKPGIQAKSALRRILIEHLANLDRALACQKRMEE